MNNPFVTTLPNGMLAVSHCVGDDADGKKKAKTMFELSRDTDMVTHFDPDVHTLVAIAAGIPGHFPLSCHDCSEADLPDAVVGDRYFRDAVEDTGTSIQVNMPKARVIHMDRIRTVRNAELEKLDGSEQVAIRSGDTLEVDRIRALKTKLADIPQTFDLTLAVTPEELKALWPAELA